MGEGVPGDTGGGLGALAAGSRVAGYLLEEEVGAGGMAVVFRARDERLDRRAALKLLAPRLASDEEFRRRFLRESRAAAAVDDPHIIPVYEAGEAGGVLFLAMRYVSGGDVRGLLRREGPLAPARVAAIISPVASALDAAHGAGLVHRDVKPGNMLIDARQGRPDHVYLSDFGLAKSGATSAPTRTGLYLGTAAYMAPEQIQGTGVDGRADQYALGCAAFELLCGKVPFERDKDLAVIWAHLSAPPPPVASRRAGLPPGVDEVLARALAKAPDDRYPSCREFAEALRQALGLPGYYRDPGIAPGATVTRPAAQQVQLSTRRPQTQRDAISTCSSCGTENPSGQRFCGECGTALSVPGEVRRRLITVLYCDMVGSTELGERLDAERLRKVLDRYFGAMRAAIQHHGGTVEKFIGDAVAGTFGIPEAHEDDALRAVRAALEMQEAAAEIDAEIDDPGVRMVVRIAIHSGEAFADEAAATQGRIAGDVFNTAARLQAIAEPGDVVVSAAAERMLRRRVIFAALGVIELKGKAKPVSAYRVLEIRPTSSRLETPLVGRERPLRLLNEAMQDAIDNHMCVLVTVLAPPGVGKSRLATSFADAVRESATVLVGQTPSYGNGVTFAPLVELLSQAAERPSGDAEEVAAVLHQRVAGQRDGAAIGDRIAQVLGVGETLASEASWAVRRLLEVLASERPLVVVLEDLHWAEAPMLDLADAVIGRIHGPVLFLCLARPEFLEERPTWAAGKLRAITLTLPPLSPEDARQLAEHLLGGQAPALVVDRVCQIAEGNPLYLEQLTAMLADQGLLVDGQWAGVEDVEIPSTLQALLAARLDRLDPVPRLILERASVEGRRFRITAISALAPEVSPDEVKGAIASLEGKGLLRAEEEVDGRWRFAHALVRETVYRTLSKELRADLHERLADWMMAEDADQADVDESVARHLEHAVLLRQELGERPERSAALSERAGGLFAAAGTRAFAALDYITSSDLLGRAAALLPLRSHHRLALLPNLGAALADSGRAEESEALLAEGITQARAMGLEREALRATVQLLSNRIYGSSTQAEIDSSAVEARRALDAFAVMSDGVGMAEAAIALDNLAFVRGHIAEAQLWASEALRHALAAGRPREATQGAGDLLGFAIVGPLPFDEFPATARGLPSRGEPMSDSVSHALMAVAALAAGDDGGFEEHQRRWRDLLDRHGLAWLAAAQAMEIAMVELSVGRAEAAERRIREAREFFVAIGNLWYISIADEFLCAAVGAQDRPREFLKLADAFAATVLVTDQENLIRRQLVLARAHLLRGSPGEAEIAATRGLELAEQTDLVLDHADALLMLADVLDALDRGDDAAIARSEALMKLRAKGNLAAVARLTSEGGQRSPSF